jgi:hypothetical protein
VAKLTGVIGNTVCGRSRCYSCLIMFRPIWKVSRAEDRATQGCDLSADSEAEM